MTMRPVNEMERTIATAVLKAMQINQDSYDKEAADAAGEERDYVDYKEFYRIPLDKACEMALPGAMGRLIYLACEAWWNDAQIWAQQVLDPTGTAAPTLENCQHGMMYNNNPPVEEDVIPEFKWACSLCEALHKANS